MKAGQCVLCCSSLLSFGLNRLRLSKNAASVHIASRRRRRISLRLTIVRGVRRSIRLQVAVSALAAVVGVSCGSGGTDSKAITVFAAASLSAAFTELGDAFEMEYPNAEVDFNFASSSSLVAQIIEGAPADVFASADTSNMAKLTDAGNNASTPTVFATNRAEIVVGAGNPMGITGVEDLANDDLIVVQCAPEVPCGRYAAQIFANAGVTVTPKSFEENVNAVVTKVTLGEADAGIVYRTDVLAVGTAADGVEIPTDINVIAEYPIAVTSDAPNSDGAEAFVAFVGSEQGQDILSSYGFLEP